MKNIMYAAIAFAAISVGVTAVSEIAVSWGHQKEGEHDHEYMGDGSHSHDAEYAEKYHSHEDFFMHTVHCTELSYGLKCTLH